MDRTVNGLLDIVFQLVFCIAGLTGFFLLIGFLGHFGTIAVLIAGVYLFFMIGLLYFLHPRLFPDTPYRELNETEKEDRHECEIVVNRSYPVTFDLCFQALQSFESIMIDDIDQTNGTISARTPVRLFTRYGFAQSIITIQLQKMAPVKTSVKISSFCEQFSFPVNGKNLENITKLRSILQRQPSSEVREDTRDGNVASGSEYSYKQRILKKPEIAAQLSIIPGFGHIYAGQYRKGIVLGLITTLLIYIPFILAISDVRGDSHSLMNDIGMRTGNEFVSVFFFIPAILLWLYTVFDARVSAGKVNAGVYPFYSLNTSILLLYLLGFIALVCVMGGIIVYFLM
jgi:TM2 domain-containing membrane protein YozV